MRPTLFSLTLGGHELGVHSYGVLVGLGFAVGIVLAWRAGPRAGFDRRRLLDLSFWGLVLALAGARATYVLLNAPQFVASCRTSSAAGHGPAASTWSLSGCLAPLRFWEGGLVFYGGLVAAAAVALVFARREAWSFGRLADLFAPSAAIGHAIGRIGCLAAGCCFGKATTVPWGVAYPPGSAAHEHFVAAAKLPEAAPTPPLHPTQAYEALAELSLFVLLIVSRRRWRHTRTPPAPGALFAVYAGGYAALRLVLEMLRGDVGRRFVATWTNARLAALLQVPPEQALFLSASQVISILVLGAVACFWYWRLRRPVATRSS